MYVWHMIQIPTDKNVTYRETSTILQAPLFATYDTKHVPTGLIGYVGTKDVATTGIGTVPLITSERSNGAVM